MGKTRDKDWLVRSWLRIALNIVRLLLTNKITPRDIAGVGVNLKVDDDLALLALLHADGSINRLGSGALNNTEKEMFIGVTDPELFQSLRAQLTPDLLRWVGGRADKNPRGKVCELQIYLILANKKEQIIYFKYGSDSIGPPPEVCQLVKAVVEITNPWYEDFKAMSVRKDVESFNLEKPKS